MLPTLVNAICRLEVNGVNEVARVTVWPVTDEIKNETSRAMPSNKTETLRLEHSRHVSVQTFLGFVPGKSGVPWNLG